MKLEVEQIDMEREEEVIVRCHDVGADWVGNVKDAAHLRRRCRSSLRAAQAWQALKAGRRRARNAIRHRQSLEPRRRDLSRT